MKRMRSKAFVRNGFAFLSVVVLCVAVQALQVMYTSVNSPSQLTGWKSSGGDPCGESWKGVTCEGTAVVSMYDLYLCKCGFDFLFNHASGVSGSVNRLIVVFTERFLG